MNKTDNHKKRFLEALSLTCGNVSEASVKADLSRSNHYDWIKEDPDYAKAVDMIEDANIDFAESKLRQLMDGVTMVDGVTDDGEPIVYKVPPNATALIFFLKCKAKKRGYVERQEITGTDGSPIHITISDKI